MATPRSIDLPEYAHPPLNEVALGVQFSPPIGYSQLHAGGVWQLFRDEYPIFEEHESLPQAFETFGAGPVMTPSFELIQGPRHDRFWFIGETLDELVQFQDDRLHFNWRMQPGGKAYPRFEYLVEKFFNALRKLDNHFTNEFGNEISVVQAEISYINHFPYIVDGKSKQISDWVNFVDVSHFHPEDLNLRMRYPLQRDGNLYGRVNLDLATAIKQPSEKIAVLTTTVRGMPKSGSLDDLDQFFSESRRLIVTTFDNVTTERAHSYWNRTEQP
jgi:uncharacterized protein (TIGR04255 family)